MLFFTVLFDLGPFALETFRCLYICQNMSKPSKSGGGPSVCLFFRKRRTKKKSNSNVSTALSLFYGFDLFKCHSTSWRNTLQSTKEYGFGYSIFRQACRQCLAWRFLRYFPELILEMLLWLQLSRTKTKIRGMYYLVLLHTFFEKYVLLI